MPKKFFSRSVHNSLSYEKIEAYWVLRPDGPSIPRGRVVIRAGKTKRVELELDERYLKPKKSRDGERELKEWEKRKIQFQEREKLRKQQQRREEREKALLNQQEEGKDKNGKKVNPKLFKRQQSKKGNGEGKDVGVGGDHDDESTCGSSGGYSDITPKTLENSTDDSARKRVYLVVRKISDRFGASMQEYLVEGDESEMPSPSSSTPREENSPDLWNGGTHPVAGVIQPLVFPRGARA